MAGLWSVRQYGRLRCAPVVWPCARPCALLRPPRERFHGWCVGRPAVLDPVGWGTPPPTSPRAADRSGRRTPPPGLCVGQVVRKACTERVRVCPAKVDLAENRLWSLRANSAPTTSLEGARGVFGECIGGAFTSQICRWLVLGPSPVRGRSVAARPPVRCRFVAGDALVKRRRGALQGAQAAPGALPCASFVAAWCPVRTVHWLSTACGGGDAVVGGVEQYRRQSA